MFRTSTFVFQFLLSLTIFCFIKGLRRTSHNDVFPKEKYYPLVSLFRHSYENRFLGIPSSFFFACRKYYQIWEDFEQVKRGKYRSIIMVLFSVIVNCEKFHAVSQIRNISCSFLLFVTIMYSALKVLIICLIL